MSYVSVKCAKTGELDRCRASRRAIRICDHARIRIRNSKVPIPNPTYPTRAVCCCDDSFGPTKIGISGGKTEPEVEIRCAWLAEELRYCIVSQAAMDFLLADLFHSPPSSVKAFLMMKVMIISPFINH